MKGARETPISRFCRIAISDLSGLRLGLRLGLRTRLTAQNVLQRHSGTSDGRGRGMGDANQKSDSLFGIELPKGPEPLGQGEDRVQVAFTPKL